MPGIPPANSTDAEDVAWGLQTAEALWKRGERIDALVWLRRAAQAAGDANDDDRALELARYAAELSDWMASGEGEDAAEEIHDDGVVVHVETDDVEADGSAEFADSEASTSPGDRAALDDLDDEAAARGSDTDRPARIPSAPPLDVPAHTLPPADDEDDDDYVQVSEEEIELSDEPPSTPDLPPDHEPSVLPADRVHAGMFNPWEESEASSTPSETAPESDEATPPDGARVDSFEVPLSAPAAEASASDGELVTSAPKAPSGPPSIDVSPPRPSETSRVAPPLPPRPKPPLPPSAALKAAPPPPAVAAASPAPPPAAPSIVAAPPAPSAPAVPVAAPSAPEPPPAAAPPAAPALELENVDAFADLPDDAREAFARAAKIDDLAEGEEVQKFALAYAIEGTFDVAATFVDAPAARVDTGAVLRARGSLGEGVPMRLVCTSKTGRVATWTDAAVDEAFRTIPWVEDDLRAASDRVQTLVGITIGPLGERLDASIRDTIVERLQMRAFSPGERVVEAGEQVPGLLLVGIGELEVVAGDEVQGSIGSGEFLFPGEVLGGGNAPNAVRAGRLGAIALFGDRKLAQELLVTCPPLLEVFAGM